ncbi:hypothetical protein NC653_041190 [Populus alba x Populus x berolinensis]|uniref:Uncharacterized protein n=1 Tax=Populus alba x Populus x berolinensis TaxID=444605 RepID=A0AAD6L8X2_9ROSI|nr:hypothetical protein NC653_041190 [Populus alba x Populus x berolinensis]
MLIEFRFSSMLAMTIMPSALIAIFLIMGRWCSMAWVAFCCSNSKVVIIAYQFSFTWIPITVTGLLLASSFIKLISFLLLPFSGPWCSTAWVASCCSNSKIAIIAYVLQVCFF